MCGSVAVRAARERELDAIKPAQLHGAHHPSVGCGDRRPLCHIKKYCWIREFGKVRVE